MHVVIRTENFVKNYSRGIAMSPKILTPLIMLFIINNLFAGTTGKIAGFVRDKNTGLPIPGVNIQIEDQFLGAASDINGEYFIIKIPVGKHKITASFIGYKTFSYNDIEIEVDRTVVVNFSLEEEILEMSEPISVVAERERIKKDLTMSSQHVSTEEIAALPVESFESVAMLQAGAVGTHFRGGRSNQVVPVIDGMNIRDATAGYYQPYRYRDEHYLQTNLLLPESSIEQMQVITGGFNAEYGNAQSAIINLITKEGGPKHSGRIVIKTSAFNHTEKSYWYKNPQGEFVYYRDQYLQEFFDRAQPSDSLLALGVRGPSIKNALSDNNLEYYELGNYNRQEYEFSLSGPVPFTSDKLRYSLNGEIVEKNRSKLSYNGPQFQAAFQSKLIYRISPSDKLQLLGVGSWINSRAIELTEAKYPGGYMPGYGEIPPKIDTEEYDFNRNYMTSIKWTHAFSNKTFLELQAGYKYNSFERKNKDWNDRDGDGDFNEFLEWKKILRPEDKTDPNSKWIMDWCYVTDDMQWQWIDAHGDDWQGGWKMVVPGKSQWREIWVLNNSNYTYDKPWRYLTGHVNEQELTSYPIVALQEDKLFPTVPNKYFYYYGDGRSYYDTENYTYSLKADITSQITLRHLLKAGIDLALTKMDMFRIGYIAETWYWFDDYNVQPLDIAAYIQDKMEFEGLIINAGLRFDYFDPGDNIIYPGDFNRPYDVSKQPGDEDYILKPQKAKPFISLSPRLGISHPISENSVLHFTYGYFYQRPEYRYWYQNMGHNPRGVSVSNPTMKPEKTISYEAGIKQNIGQFLLGFNVFYKDIFNLANVKQAGERPTYIYWLWSSRDWADVRGFEITLRKFFSDYFAGGLNYTYMIAKGNDSDPWDFEEQLGAANPYYLDWDQRHTFNANITLSLPEKFGLAFAGLYPFGDWNFNMLYSFNSPQPYTPTSRDVQKQLNTKRLKSRMQTDIKISKRFVLSNNIKALFLIEGYNIFNHKNLLYVTDIEWYEQTGNPEGYNQDPEVWDMRRFFRVGLGFEF
jgi:outer membrane receptor protein involved in Fe transport